MALRIVAGGRLCLSRAWAETILPQLSSGSDLAKASPTRWTALTRVFDDGRIALDNNPAERALRTASPPARTAVPTGPTESTL